jgi:hypothetical protein
MNATVAPSRLIAPHVDGLDTPAAPQLIERITLARADSAIHALAGRIAFRQQEIIRKFSYDAAIQAAVLATDPAAGIVGIIEHLENQFNSVSTELAELNSAMKLAESRGKSRSAEIGPMIRRAGNATIRVENEILRLKLMINDARRNGGFQPSEKLKAYRSAGLSAEQIAKLGDAGTTAHDVEQAEWRIKVAEGELQRLTAFINDPLHRVSQLQGLELTEADDNNPGRFTSPPVHQNGDVK